MRRSLSKLHRKRRGLMTYESVPECLRYFKKSARKPHPMYRPKGSRKRTNGDK